MRYQIMQAAVGVVVARPAKSRMTKCLALRSREDGWVPDNVGTFRFAM